MNDTRLRRPRGRRSGRSTAAAALVVLVAALLAPLGTASGASATKLDGAGYERAVVAQINKVREARGIGPVRVVPCLDKIAEARALLMLRTHSAARVSTRMMTEECRRPLGLNAAAITSTTPRALVRSWLRTRDKRSVLLDRRVRWLGVGAVAPATRRWHVSLLLVGRQARTPQPVSIEEAAPAGEADTGTTTTLARTVQDETLTELEKLQAAILRVTNRRRERHDLSPLKASPCATTFAERHSTWMASEGELAHSRLGRLLEKCSVRGVAENVAAHWGSAMEARSVVQAWMDSRGHRANILDPDLTHLGVGVAYDKARGTWYATQDFLRTG